MITLFLILVHIGVSLMLILVVLLQTGKRADLAGAFGGGGSQTAFGARGAATFLSKATTWSAITFMVTSIVLGLHFGTSSEESIVQDTGTPSAPTAPAVPVPQPVPAPSLPADEGQPGAADVGARPAEAPAEPAEAQAGGNE